MGWLKRFTDWMRAPEVGLERKTYRFVVVFEHGRDEFDETFVEDRLEGAFSFTLKPESLARDFAGSLATKPYEYEVSPGRYVIVPPQQIRMVSYYEVEDDDGGE